MIMNKRWRMNKCFYFSAPLSRDIIALMFFNIMMSRKVSHLTGVFQSSLSTFGYSRNWIRLWRWVRRNRKNKIVKVINVENYKLWKVFQAWVILDDIFMDLCRVSLYCIMLLPAGILKFFAVFITRWILDWSMKVFC